MSRGMSAESRWNLAKTIVISTSSYATILSFPAVLGAFARAFNFTDHQIGMIGSAELVGVTCGTLIMANQTGRRMKLWLFVGATLVGVGNVFASRGANLNALMLGMWFVGVGAGLGGGFAYKLGGQSRNPSQFIAFVHTSQLLGGVVGYQALNYFLPAYGIARVLQGYATLSLLIVITALSIRLDEAAVPQRAASFWSLPPSRAMWVLLGFWFYCCGEVGLWAFLERIGASKGLSVEVLSYALSGLSAAGICASLTIAFVPPDVSRTRILIAALAFGLVAVLGVARSNTLSQYVVSLAALGVFFFFTIPVILGIVSNIDTSGRSTALGLTVASTGQAIGPAVAGSLVINHDYTRVGWFAAVCYSLAIATVLCSLRRSHRAPVIEPA
jgi:predicted MFS family arabinose efflux permease